MRVPQSMRAGLGVEPRELAEQLPESRGAHRFGILLGGSQVSMITGPND